MTKDEILKLEGRELDVVVAERVMGWRWLNLPGLCRPCFKPPDEIAQFLPEFVEQLTVTCDDSPPDRLPHYSADMSAAWQVFIAGLVNLGTASIYADMEDYGRGAILSGNAEQVVHVAIGDMTVCAPVCEAICKAALLAVLDTQ